MRKCPNCGSSTFRPSDLGGRCKKCVWGVNTTAAPEKKDFEIRPDIKPADQITNVDVSIGDFATIYGKCKTAVEDIYGTKALTQEHIAAVDMLFIQVSKDKYFKEKNNE